jgi:hypothetical protein
VLGGLPNFSFRPKIARMERTSIAILAILLIGSCHCSKTKDAPRPQDAKGETPIRYVICSGVGDDCFVEARFANLDACKIHKKRQAAACADDPRHPGRVTCDPNPQPITATTSYCVP